MSSHISSSDLHQHGAHAIMREQSRLSALESFGITQEALDRIQAQRQTVKEARKKRETQLHGESLNLF